ncbi:MAG: hypothetical protein E4G93_04790, partial [Dehalococcoidia bacterium]
TGQTLLTGVKIVDDYDEVHVASIGSISDSGIWDEVGGTITWDIGPLNPGDDGEVTYQATLVGTFGTGTTTVDNVAIVTTDQTPDDEDDASVTVTIAPPPPGGAALSYVEPTCWFDVDMLGNVTRVYVTCVDGRCIGDYEPDDPPEVNFLELMRGTRVTYNLNGQFNGGPPRWVRMRVLEDPPPAPEGQVFVTEVYTFLGYTATGLQTDSVFFDAIVGMQLDYDPDALPGNATGVGIAWWNPDTSEWEFLPQGTGRVAGVGTATADVMHFSTFAVLATTGEAVQEAPTPIPTPAAPSGARPATFAGTDLQIEPAIEKMWSPLTFVTRTGNTVTISAMIENLGDEEGTYTAELSLDGKVIGTQDVSLAGGEQKQVRFVVSGIATGEYSIQVAGLSGTFASSREVTWWLIAVVSVLPAAIAGWLILRQYRKRRLA